MSQALVNDVLCDYLNHVVFVCLDEIFIFSPDLETQRNQMCLVLERLLQHDLDIKAETCEFHSSVLFPGFIISEGAAMEPDKVAAFKDWPRPTTWKHLQQFLGFANFYGKFI